MTLQTYGSERLDGLALRLLDLAAMFREMAKEQRQVDVKSISLNDRKLLEWLGNIEVWAQDARGRLHTEVVRLKGAQRAQSASRKR